MNIGGPGSLRRSLSLAAAGVLVVALAACTGRGGGYLPPNAPVFTGQASFGFSFSCERSSGSTNPNPKPGRLRIQLSYTDHGTNPIGSAFSVHGTVDPIDPVLESQICVGQEPPPGANELIFLGRYRLTSGSPARFPSACPTRETSPNRLCRFEIIVRDNDRDRAPSMGDFFSIRLSTVRGPVTGPQDSQLPASAVFYTRAGLLAGGNITVD